MPRKDARQLVRALERAGFEVRLRKAGHLAVRRKDGTGKTVFMAASPSDHRSVKNSMKLLREIGYEPEGQK